MSQTIDQLLTDVSPLLPIEKRHDSLGFYYHTCKAGDMASLTQAQEETLETFSRHAANKFPAMLAALREALQDIQTFNIMARMANQDCEPTNTMARDFRRVHPFTRLESQLEQALAAATEVGE